MKFTCKVPVLQNAKAFPFLHVEASGSMATFTAFTGETQTGSTDYIYVQVTVPAVVEEAGGASFESSSLKPFARKEVAFSTDTSKPQAARISFGAAGTQVRVLDSIKMPPENTAPLSLVTLDFGPSDVISKDATRPHLNYLHLQARGGQVQATATDGHRMHRISTLFAGADFEMTVPRFAADALRATKDTEAMCAPGFVRIGATTVRFHPWRAAFPPCDRIIPQGMERTTFLPVKELISLLKAYPKALEVDVEESGNLLLHISEEEMKITRFGYFDRTVEAKTAGLQPGETFKIGVCLKYLISALELVGEGATTGTSGDLDPLLIQSGERLAVVMPCRS